MWLKENDLSHYVPTKCVSLLHSMLHMVESQI